MDWLDRDTLERVRPNSELHSGAWASGASVRSVDLEKLERQLRQRLDALGSAPGAELLHVLMLPDFERADAIGEFWGYQESRAFAELLIDCEEDRTPGGAHRGAAGGRLLAGQQPRGHAGSLGAPRVSTTRRSPRLTHQDRSRRIRSTSNLR
jgi:hypothetical protein